jgi:hypothetical protein
MLRSHDRILTTHVGSLVRFATLAGRENVIPSARCLPRGAYPAGSMRSSAASSSSVTT